MTSRAEVAAKLGPLWILEGPGPWAYDAAITVRARRVDTAAGIEELHGIRGGDHDGDESAAWSDLLAAMSAPRPVRPVERESYAEWLESWGDWRGHTTAELAPVDDPAFRVLWDEADAALPHGWYIGPVEVWYFGEEFGWGWLAQAHGLHCWLRSDHEMARVYGRGATALEALRDLVATLRVTDPVKVG